MQHQERVSKNELPAFIQKEKSKIADTRIRPSQDFTFFGITKTRAGEPVMSLALKLILKNGEQIIIQYHEMTSPMRYDGSGKIIFSTTTLGITIQGNNLDNIIDYLAEYRLVWIKEPDSDFLKVKEGEVEIHKDGIKIEEK